MNTEDKNRITNLFFKRVGNAETRSKIGLLAHTLAGGDENSDEYWSCLYHYALPEHLGDLERDYRQYVAGKLGLPESDGKEAKRGKPK